MTVTQTAANVIDDNNTSQPIAASESRLTTQTANWGWAKVKLLLVKPVLRKTLCILTYCKLTASSTDVKTKCKLFTYILDIYLYSTHTYNLLTVLFQHPQYFQSTNFASKFHFHSYKWSLSLLKVSFCGTLPILLS